MNNRIGMFDDETPADAVVAAWMNTRQYRHAYMQMRVALPELSYALDLLAEQAIEQALEGADDE